MADVRSTATTPSQVSTPPDLIRPDSPPEASPLLRRFIEALNQEQIAYSHWKSNLRLADSLAGADDIDLLVDRRDSKAFYALLLHHGFKLARSKSGIDHPGVFHAIALDETNATLVHVHAYFQIVSGDSLVKTYRFPIEAAIFNRSEMAHGIRIPAAEVELVIFALRVALKHVGLVETVLVQRDRPAIAAEMKWLRARADMALSAQLCAEWFPALSAELFHEIVQTFEKPSTGLIRRLWLGLRVRRRLSELRRMGTFPAMASRVNRLMKLTIGRFSRRRDLTLQTGGMIIALVGPKATGKTTLSNSLAQRFSKYLDVSRIHAGKPPATALTLVPYLLTPLARRLLPGERSGAYETSERRGGKQYSLVFVLRMVMLAYDRRRLLRTALRRATSGGLVISDRYPSVTIGSIDSSCFDDIAVAKAGSGFKRWLMLQERKIYRDLPRPGLVIRLTAPLETAILRDSMRAKDGGPDANALRRRRALEMDGDFGVPTIQVRTDRPLDATIEDIVKATWAAL